MSIIRTVGFIFARGGSKGLPGKNIRDLEGKPLIAYAIDAAMAVPNIETVIVSTDSLEIAEVSRSYGAEVPFLRPLELSQDDSSEWLAWRHAICWFEKNRGAFDIFVSIPATSPFRSTGDIVRCVEMLERHPDADVCLTVTPAPRNPFFNMVTLTGDGTAALLLNNGKPIERRQDAPQVFDITTVSYAGRPSFIKSASGIFDGKVKAVIVPAERALDIDTPFDFAVAEAIASLQIYEA